jgi:hypothetical protein
LKPDIARASPTKKDGHPKAAASENKLHSDYPANLDCTPAAAVDAIRRAHAGSIAASRALMRGDLPSALVSVLIVEKAAGVARFALEYTLGEANR